MGRSRNRGQGIQSSEGIGCSFTSLVKWMFWWWMHKNGLWFDALCTWLLVTILCSFYRIDFIIQCWLKNMPQLQFTGFGVKFCWPIQMIDQKFVWAVIFPYKQNWRVKSVCYNINCNFLFIFRWSIVNH